MFSFFQLDDEQKQFREAVEAFARSRSAEARVLERQSVFPWEEHRELGKKRWTGPIVPKQYDGMGKGVLELAIITEELARFGLKFPQPCVQAERSILVSGNDTQKNTYLPALSRGELVAAMAISEPGMGSSFKRMATRARKEGSSYVINGQKTHINLGEEAGVLLVYANTERGCTILLVDKNTPGISYKKGDPIGLRLEPIYDINFDNCKVSNSQVLGKEGDAMTTFFATFNLSRIGNASFQVGTARGALEFALAYAKKREVGENVVTDFQGIRWLVADMVTEIEAASLLRDRAAWLADNGMKYGREAAMAKLYAGTIAEKVASNVFSLVGGWGCYYDQPFERFWRDAKVGQIGGGSAEILRNFIARCELGQARTEA